MFSTRLFNQTTQLRPMDSILLTIKRITKVTKSNYNEYLPGRIYGFLFLFQYFTEHLNSSLKVSEIESSVYFESPVPVQEDFTSV